eukprot:scaffold5749_cov104-Isochrysis_galbana.AAC.4
MAPKKKKEGGEPGSKATGKATGPTQEEYAEMVLRVGELERRLLEKTAQHEAGMAASQSTQADLEKLRVDHADREAYQKREKSDLELRFAALDQQHAALTERTTAQIARLREELAQMRQSCAEASALQEAREAELTEAMTQMHQLRTLSSSSEQRVAELEAELADAQYALAAARTQVGLLALPGRAADDTGARAVPLVLVELIRAHEDKPALVEQAFTAIASTLTGEASSAPRADNCFSMAAAGGVASIAGAMRRHAHSAAVQAAGSGLLRRLALTEPSTRPTILAEGGIEIVLQSMSQHPSHPRLQYNACGALRQLLVHNSVALSVGSTISPTRRRGLPPLLPDSSRKNLPHTKPLAPPAPLGTGGYATFKGTRTMRGASLSASPHSPSGRLSLQIPSPPSRAGDEPTSPAAPVHILEQALALTLLAMDQNQDQPLVQEYSCATLWNLLMASADLRTQMFDAGGIGRVLRSMFGHPDHAGVQLNGCAVLKEVCDSARAMKLLRAGQAHEALGAVKERHANNLELIRLASEILEMLPKETM